MSDAMTDKRSNAPEIGMTPLEFEQAIKKIRERIMIYVVNEFSDFTTGEVKEIAAVAEAGIRTELQTRTVL